MLHSLFCQINRVYILPLHQRDTAQKTSMHPVQSRRAALFCLDVSCRGKYPQTSSEPFYNYYFQGVPGDAHAGQAWHEIMIPAADARCSARRAFLIKS